MVVHSAPALCCRCAIEFMQTNLLSRNLREVIWRRAASTHIAHHETTDTHGHQHYSNSFWNLTVVQVLVVYRTHKNATNQIITFFCQVVVLCCSCQHVPANVHGSVHGVLKHVQSLNIFKMSFHFVFKSSSIPGFGILPYWFSSILASQIQHVLTHFETYSSDMRSFLFRMLCD